MKSFTQRRLLVQVVDDLIYCLSIMNGFEYMGTKLILLLYDMYMCI